MNYSKIVKVLNLDERKDLEAAKILNKLLAERKVNWQTLENLHNHSVIVFGAGPSLKGDILKMKKVKAHRLLKIIAADGATRALLEERIIPDLVVTDLDGARNALIQADKLGAVIVVHAHGDNIPKLKLIVPKLKNVIGTTQTPPLGKLMNFGGFTDGDRAVFLAKNFGANLIILAGMDFGTEIGEYSEEYSNNKLQKLAVGKELIEEIATKKLILNLTGGGENLRDVPKISAKNLKILLKSN